MPLNKPNVLCVNQVSTASLTEHKKLVQLDITAQVELLPLTMLLIQMLEGRRLVTTLVKVNVHH